MSVHQRFYYFIVTVTATLCSCSCSTTSKRQALLSSLTSSSPVRALVLYREAKQFIEKDPVKSCALWREVLRESQFPLTHVAKLRALEVCTDESDHTPQIGGVVDGVVNDASEPWLSELTLRATLARSRRTGNKEWEMRLSIRAVEFEKLQSEKLKLLNRAKALALELGDATSAQQAQAKIETVAPRFKLNPVGEELLSVASDFKQARQFEKSRAIYAEVVHDTSPENNGTLSKLKALDGIRMSYKLEKRTQDYLEASRAYSDFAERELLKQGLNDVKEAKTADVGRHYLKKYFDTRIALARAIWTEDSPRKAALILRAAETDVKSYIPVHESILLRARIEEEAGRFRETVRLLKETRADKIANRETRLKILWSLAWNQKKIGQLTEAAEGLALLIDQEDSAGAASRDRFWLAKIKGELGQADNAKNEFENLIAVDPQSWYALLAYRELGLEIPPLPETLRQPASEIKSDNKSESALLPEEKLTFEWLIAVGENELAKKFLRQIAGERRPGYSDAQLENLLFEFMKAGDYQSLFATLSDLPPATKAELTQQKPALVYPQPFSNVVESAAKKFNVPVELIYSIMRQESSFDPLSRSPADAFGLMQLIPEMAKRAERRAGIKLSSHEDLYTPEINIPLGAAFIRDLLDHWKGRFIPTVASYNASEKAIAGWMRTRYRGDVLVFIEDIPYEETRNYIKLVMRNYISYQRLNSGGTKIAFPEWCLSGLQPANP